MLVSTSGRACTVHEGKKAYLISHIYLLDRRLSIADKGAQLDSVPRNAKSQAAPDLLDHTRIVLPCLVVYNGDTIAMHAKVTGLMWDGIITLQRTRTLPLPNAEAADGGAAGDRRLGRTFLAPATGAQKTRGWALSWRGQGKTGRRRPGLILFLAWCLGTKTFAQPMTGMQFCFCWSHWPKGYSTFRLLFICGRPREEGNGNAHGQDTQLRRSYIIGPFCD